MRVVLDTNVLISGLLILTGPPGKLLRTWRAGDFQFVTSARVVAELSRALARPRIRRRLSLDDASEFLELVARKATIVEPGETLAFVQRDPDDNRLSRRPSRATPTL